MSKMVILSFNNTASTGCANYSGSRTSNAAGAGNALNSGRFFAGVSLLDSDKSKYSIFDVANWFLLKETMTHKKLQKLCYYAQAWFYAVKNERLTDTVFEAWVHGPVSPVLYDKFKGFGFSAIKILENYETVIKAEDLELLESVWKTYGDRTGNALEALSHSEPPWNIARIGYSPNERCEVAISPELMKNYYQSIYLGDKCSG